MRYFYTLPLSPRLLKYIKISKNTRELINKSQPQKKCYRTKNRKKNITAE